ncbi:MAG: hypothetical protein H8E71_07050 [Candidatus Marinimicrobia bacterium]|nr:hypothetical protein [Candidatus Neomarinimicrobiota bacterium]
MDNIKTGTDKMASQINPFIKVVLPELNSPKTDTRFGCSLINFILFCCLGLLIIIYSILYNLRRYSNVQQSAMFDFRK